MKRCQEKGKFFLAEVGKNYRGEFLSVTEIFQGGKQVSIMIPKGVGGKEWSSFGRAMKDLLTSKGAKAVKGKVGVVSAAQVLLLMEGEHSLCPQKYEGCSG